MRHPSEGPNVIEANNPAGNVHGEQADQRATTVNPPFIAETDNTAPSTSARFSFVDFNVEPIPGLRFKLCVAGNEICGSTDSLGRSEILIGLAPNTQIDIRVLRDHAKSFKQIGSVVTTTGKVEYTLVSPKLKVDTSTVLHDALSEAKESLSSEHVATPVSTEKTTAVATDRMTGGPRRSIVENGLKTSSQRNKDGHPLASTDTESRDAMVRNILPSFHYWTWRDFVHMPGRSTLDKLRTTAAPASRGTSSRTKETKSVAGYVVTKAHASARTSVEPSLGKPLNERELESLTRLLEFADRQITLDYSDLKGIAGGPTTALFKKYATDKNPSFPTKNSAKSLGMCLAYVKCALHHAGYMNGSFSTSHGNAKDSGVGWLDFDFTDVSASLPSVTVEYRNVHSTAGNGKKSAGAQEPKKTIRISQPDISYTLPGDVIVYEQVHPIDENAPGHVDIRTYHGFVSDFSPIMRGGFPALGVGSGKRYRVIGVYRKLSDYIASIRVQAFLRIIREHETEGYRNPYAALQFKNGIHSTFDDDSAHPFTNSRASTPAGAFQIKLGTFERVTSMMGWPSDFKKESQDRVAILLLQLRSASESKKTETALGYIMQGKVKEAVQRTGLWNEWSILPGGADQKITMQKLIELFNDYSAQQK